MKYIPPTLYFIIGRRPRCSRSRPQRPHGLHAIEAYRGIAVQDGSQRAQAIRSNEAQSTVEPTEVRVQVQPFLDDVTARRNALPSDIGGPAPGGRSGSEMALGEQDPCSGHDLLLESLRNEPTRYWPFLRPSASMCMASIHRFRFLHESRFCQDAGFRQAADGLRSEGK